MLLPEDAARTFEANISNGKGTVRYAKLHIKLQDILTGDFFTHYIKAPGSDILLLSEGRPSIDPVFSLSQGILRLEVDKPTFERLGLTGTPVPTHGRKHVKARYAVEIDLRPPSMVKGKPGFERLLGACRNVLNHSLTWLFCDLKSDTNDSAPIDAFQPTWKTVEAETKEASNALVPAITMSLKDEDHEEAAELLEWLGLAMGGSPRIEADDGTDVYLCRYRVPAPTGAQRVVSLRWHGLIPAQFAQKILLAAIKTSEGHWLAMNAASFSGEAYTILIHNEQSITWEYKD